MVKLFILLLIILFSINFSINSRAQSIQYPDGSYYNDDLIRPGQAAPSMKAPVSLHDNTTYIAPREPAVEKPVKIVTPKKSRRAPGGFQEVNAGGRAGDFREVGGEEYTRPTSGSR